MFSSRSFMSPYSSPLPRLPSFPPPPVCRLGHVPHGKGDRVLGNNRLASCEVAPRAPPTRQHYACHPGGSTKMHPAGCCALPPRSTAKREGAGRPAHGHGSREHGGAGLGDRPDV